MSKRFLFIIVIATLSLASATQAQDFKAGLFAGAVPSQVDGDDQSGFHKVGITAGVFVNRSLKTGMLQGELAFTTKGSKPTNNAGNFPVSISLSYIDLSLYYVIGVWNNLYLRAGLVPSVLVSSSQSGAGIAITANEESSPFRAFSTELSAGLDYRFSDNWSVNIAYNYSAFSIYKGDLTFFGLRPAETNAHYNNYVKLTLAYQF
ncbi:MAG: porin family protein [Bacteroidales bacterium]|jgi:opacity protein-like surface antigen|nr:porin family protein [Bacteroidales bacterium]